MEFYRGLVVRMSDGVLGKTLDVKMDLLRRTFKPEPKDNFKKFLGVLLESSAGSRQVPQR